MIKEIIHKLNWVESLNPNMDQLFPNSISCWRRHANIWESNRRTIGTKPHKILKPSRLRFHTKNPSPTSNTPRFLTVTLRSSSNFPLHLRYFSSFTSASPSLSLCNPLPFSLLIKPSISPLLSSSRQNSTRFLGFFNPRTGTLYWVVLRFWLSGCWLSCFWE